jgi:hypothetical protein
LPANETAICFGRGAAILYGAGEYLPVGVVTACPMRANSRRRCIAIGGTRLTARVSKPNQIKKSPAVVAFDRGLFGNAHTGAYRIAYWLTDIGLRSLQFGKQRPPSGPRWYPFGQTRPFAIGWQRPSGPRHHPGPHSSAMRMSDLSALPIALAAKPAFAIVAMPITIAAPKISDRTMVFSPIVEPPHIP